MFGSFFFPEEICKKVCEFTQYIPKGGLHDKVVLPEGFPQLLASPKKQNPAITRIFLTNFSLKNKVSVNFSICSLKTPEGSITNLA